MPASSQFITIRGLKEVSASLKRMDKKAAVRLIRKSFRRALVPVRDLTKSLAPKQTGLLASAVKILAGRSYRGLVRQRIVIARGVTDSGKKAFHGSLQELGWKQGRMKLGDKRTKIIPKDAHYMKRAFDQLGQPASDKAEEYLWDEIVKVFGAKAGL